MYLLVWPLNYNDYPNSQETCEILSLVFASDNHLDLPLNNERLILLVHEAMHFHTYPTIYSLDIEAYVFCYKDQQLCLSLWLLVSD